MFCIIDSSHAKAGIGIFWYLVFQSIATCGHTGCVLSYFRCTNCAARTYARIFVVPVSFRRRYLYDCMYVYVCVCAFVCFNKITANQSKTMQIRCQRYARVVVKQNSSNCFMWKVLKINFNSARTSLPILSESAIEIYNKFSTVTNTTTKFKSILPLFGLPLSQLKKKNSHKLR